MTAYPTGYADPAAVIGSEPGVASPAAACLIDNNLATATVRRGKSGYMYVINGWQEAL